MRGEIICNDRNFGKMRREVRALHRKAVDSLVLGVDHFNRTWDRGRTEAVLIFLDRAFELVLKGIIVHRGGKIRGDREDLTIGFDSCLRKCLSEEPIRCLSEDDALSVQNLNSLRDAAQHYLVELPEQLLYIYAQAAVTLLIRVTKEVLARPLKDDVPARVIPLCPVPPKNLGAVLDLEFADIRAMVGPGSRKRLDAKARLRAVAVLQNSLDGRKSQPSDRELDALVKKINDGQEWRLVFPGVATLRIDPEADGPGLSIRITRNRGEEVSLVAEGTPGATVMVVKRVNELDYYSLGMRDLEKKLGIPQARILLLMKRDKLQADSEYFKLIKIGGSHYKRYSPKALDYLVNHKSDIEDLWQRRSGGV
jgi:hypothetical protein